MNGVGVSRTNRPDIRYAVLPPCRISEERPVKLLPVTGRGFYPELPAKETGLVMIALIVSGLAGTIGVGLFWIALLARWV